MNAQEKLTALIGSMTEDEAAEAAGTETEVKT